MQIQLKQSEIITALKQYITSQGINLVNKEVTISFTAGRKEAGVTADLSIEDSSIPGFDDSEEDTPKPNSAAVSAFPVLKVADEPVVIAEAPQVDEVPPKEAAVVKTPTNLFN